MPIKQLLLRRAALHHQLHAFLRGASHPEELVARAKELGYAALAITDECSLAGVVRAHVEAKNAKDAEHDKSAEFPLIIGSEFRLDDGLRLVLLATDRESYGRLSALITRGRRSAEKGSYRLTRADLADGVEGCLALWIPGRESDDGAFPDTLDGCRTKRAGCLLASAAVCGSPPSVCSMPTTQPAAKS